MPDVENDELCMLMTKITFFFTKTSRTHAPQNFMIRWKITFKLSIKTEQK